VNITDFSLLATSFLQCGDIAVSAPPQSSLHAAAEETVRLSLEPAQVQASQGEVVQLEIQVESGSQEVDGVEVHLDFDPLYLHVVDSEGEAATEIEDAGALDWELVNTADNVAGEIDFAAGSVPPDLPSGTLTIGTIRFKALQDTGSAGTQVSFVTRDGNPTNITHQGLSVLDEAVPGVVTVGTHSYTAYLPCVSK
jgi:hypothetical protein